MNKAKRASVAGAQNMSEQHILPDGENLRRAIHWLSEQGGPTMLLIDEASQRFDLTPLEEEFLLRQLDQHPAP